MPKDRWNYGCPPRRPRRRRPRAEGLFKEEMEGGVTAALLPPINVSELAASKLRWGGINLGPHFPGSKRGHPRDISISMRTLPAGLGGQGSQVELIRLFSVSHHLHPPPLTMQKKMGDRDGRV